VLRVEGGVNEFGLAIGERNVLGLGFELGAIGVISNDVDQAAFRWRDRRVLATRWDAGVDFQFDDLSRYRAAALTLPFHSDTARWTSDCAVGLLDGERRLFETGEETARFDVHEDRVESAVAVHAPGARLGKFGVFQTWRRVRGDATGDVAAVGVAGAILSRVSHYRRNVDQFGPEEEISQGWTLQLGLGADLRALGASHDRLLYRTEAAAARFLGDDVLCGIVARHHAFVRGGALADGRLAAELYGFWGRGQQTALAWRLGGDALLDELPYTRFDLGSEDRLRGYEARALNGTRVAYAGIEQRLFSRWRVAFLRIGAVAFVDAAAAWDDGEALDRSHARLGGGVGLRLGTDPTGSNVTRVDIGFGTRSVELVISSGSFFSVGRTLAFPTTRLFQ
jgi:outer membrane translocation and assembly module TamA